MPLALKFGLYLPVAGFVTAVIANPLTPLGAVFNVCLPSLQAIWRKNL